MTHLIVIYRKDGKTEFINILGDRVEKVEGIIYAYSGTELVAAVDVGCLDLLYLSNKN